MLDNIELGDCVPVKLSNKLGWSIILSTFNENRHIVEHLDLKIYRVLFDSKVFLIDESCIYNALIELGLNYEL